MVLTRSTVFHTLYSLFGISKNRVSTYNLAYLKLSEGALRFPFSLISNGFISSGSKGAASRSLKISSCCRRYCGGVCFAICAHWSSSLCNNGKFAFRKGITNGLRGKLVASWSWAWNSSIDMVEFWNKER